MQGVMNAFAQTSARALSGSKLDNRRVSAALIDLAIVAAGAVAILVAAGVLGGGGGSLGAPLAVVVVGWALYYYFACESGGGQTVGKRVMRLRVVREDGGPAGMREIAIRTVLRVVDTALIGLIAMMATGERRARLGDLAAGTMIVSADGAPGPAPAEAAPAAIAAPVVEDELEADREGLAEVEDELEADGEELAEVGDDEPPVGYEPITGVAAAEEAKPLEAEPVDDEPGEDQSVVDVPVEDEGPAGLTSLEHTLDVATPSLRELAEDVAAVAGTGRTAEPEPEPVVELAPEPRPRPLAEVEIGGPEIDVDEPRVTIRSVDTVSAIDLVMGADEPSEDRPAADEPPSGA
jgi:uncharacterized RDD family membrane protein YckC